MLSIGQVCLRQQTKRPFVDLSYVTCEYSKMTDSGLAKAVQRNFQSSMTEHYRSHLDGTNINKTSMLTTDYLNHFSGVLMLIEMLPADPEGFAADVLEWSPMTYEEHFEVTGFRDKELAIKAYEHAPSDVRSAFDEVVNQLNDTLVDVLNKVQTSVETKQTEELAHFCSEITPGVRDLIGKAADIVNDGTTNVVELAMAAEEELVDDVQNEIDALFD